MFAKPVLGLLILSITAFFTAGKPAHSPKSKEHAFFVGTYTEGESEGIYRYVLLPDGKLKRQGLVASEKNPSFLTKSKDNRYLLAVNEMNNDAGTGGTVASYAIEGDQLTFIDRKPSGGDSPCYVSIDKSGDVLTANYHSGTVGLLKLSATGTLTGPLDITQHTGSGSTPRQKEPHAHSAFFEPKGEAVISIDLGTNELWFSKIDRENQRLSPLNPAKLAMEPGSGPRHLAFHPKKPWAYVINELSSTVTQVRKNKTGTYELVKSISTLPAGYTGDNACADIHISKDGKFLYASNRGHNSIAIYRVNRSDGSLELLGHESTRGDWPRNFTLSPDNSFLLVANQRGNSIISFKRDKKTGTLEYVDEIQAPSPVCLLF